MDEALRERVDDLELRLTRIEQRLDPDKMREVYDLLRKLADYVECVPDDRYNAEHLDRDALVTEAKHILGMKVL